MWTHLCNTRHVNIWQRRACEHISANAHQVNTSFEHIRWIHAAAQTMWAYNDNTRHHSCPKLLSSLQRSNTHDRDHLPLINMIPYGTSLDSRKHIRQKWLAQVTVWQDLMISYTHINEYSWIQALQIAQTSKSTDFLLNCLIVKVDRFPYDRKLPFRSKCQMLIFGTRNVK